MAKLTLDQIVESSQKKYESVEVDVPVYGVDGNKIEGHVETVVLRHPLSLPREKRQSFATALSLEERVSDLLELPEEERPDSDAVALYGESIREAFKTVTKGGEERFNLLAQAFANHDPENPEALTLWIDLFDTYNEQIELEKA